MSSFTTGGYFGRRRGRGHVGDDVVAERHLGESGEVAKHLRLAELREVSAARSRRRPRGAPRAACPSKPGTSIPRSPGEPSSVTSGSCQAAGWKRCPRSSEHLLERRRESVDVGSACAAPSRSRARPPELRVARAERYAAEDSPLEERGVHLLDGAPARARSRPRHSLKPGAVNRLATRLGISVRRPIA